jgi:hypothetical protein
MQTLNNIIIAGKEGKPIIDQASGLPLNTANLIIICLGQSKYTSMTEQWQAYDITKKLTSGEEVKLEDAEYELVKRKVEAFDPYRNGFTFMPFLELFK